MSIETTNEIKEVNVVKEERTWRLEIFTDKNTGYKVRIHREEAETIDGVVKTLTKKEALVIPVADILSSDEVVTYTDIDGVDKTIPAKDLPIIIAKWADLRATEATEI